MRSWSSRPRNRTDQRGLAEGMFSQIDPLSLPGAGLRHADFPPDVNGMFEGLFIPREDVESPPAGPGSIPTPGAKQPVVRAYGSEQEMSVLEIENGWQPLT